MRIDNINGKGTKKLVRADGSEEFIPSKCEGIQVKVGDVLYFNTWGGGGWGDRYARDPQLVMDDVNRGLVTAKGAERYGVVIADGAVDETATATLRDKLISERGDDIPLFNYGGTIEEIKARCKEETGFEPPVTPVFR